MRLRDGELLSREYVECIYVTNISRLRQRAESGKLN